MSIKAILFDLDGTLLPMDLDVFVKDYFGRLAKHLAPHGFEPEKLIKTIWQGTGAMVANDGSATNESRFWQTFAKVYGDEVLGKESEFERFYIEKFDLARASCGFDEGAPRAVAALKERGYRLILATNPIFPSIATYKRVAWAGLDTDDFELITTYENSSFCKPNPGYYREILEKTGLSPEECLMVGNDVGEDMIASELGMKVFLIPRDIINKNNKDISVYPSGDFDALVEYVDGIAG